MVTLGERMRGYSLFFFAPLCDKMFWFVTGGVTAGGALVPSSEHAAEGRPQEVSGAAPSPGGERRAAAAASGTAPESIHD